MFALAFFLGTFSYVIFALGIGHLLYSWIVIPVSLLSIGVFLYLIRDKLHHAFSQFHLPESTFAKVLLLLLGTQIAINVIGALGPELGFDALWYHEALPKLYISQHQIFHSTNGLFYYSDMPKLIEMLYTALLSFGIDIFPKLLHFSLGLACCLSLYFLARKFFSQTLALATILIFYTNLVVGWESISGYIDLGRTFFEILAVWAFVNWEETNKRFWLLCTGVMIGFAITAKLLAFGTLGIFLVLIVLRNLIRKTSLLDTLKAVGATAAISIFIPLPWLIFSYVHTGNPFYPFFSSAYPISPAGSVGNPVQFVSELWNIFTNSPDPISPIYLAFLPLVVWFGKRSSFSIKLLYAYGALSLLVWYVTPRTGGGRFILPYLPVLSLVSVSTIQYVEQHMQKVLLWIILGVGLISIVYRATANAKFFPVIIGKETTAQFLTTHLNFSFGDFYDTDGFFKTHIRQSSDLVLLIGFHNLFYVDFPFTLDYKNQDINYIAVQGPQTLPQQFRSWKRIYENNTTHVTVYEK